MHAVQLAACENLKLSNRIRRPAMEVGNSKHLADGEF